VQAGIGDIAQRAWEGISEFGSAIAGAARATWDELGYLKDELIQLAKIELFGSLSISPPSLQFRAGEGDITATPFSQSIVIRNFGGFATPVQIQSVSMQHGTYFQILQVSPSLPVSLSGGQSVTVTVTCSAPLLHFLITNGLDTQNFNDNV